MEMQRGGVLTPLDPLLSGSLRRGSRLAERRTAERLQATLRTQQGRRRVVRDPEMVQALAVLRGRVRELRAAPSPVQAGSISFGASSQWGDTVDSRGMRVSMGRSSTAMGFRSSLGNSIDQFDERLSSRVSVGVTKDNLEVRLPTPGHEHACCALLVCSAAATNLTRNVTARWQNPINGTEKLCTPWDLRASGGQDHSKPWILVGPAGEPAHGWSPGRKSGQGVWAETPEQYARPGPKGILENNPVRHRQWARLLSVGVAGD